MQDHRIWKEPSRIIEGMVVVGLHPNCDIRPLQSLSFGRKSEGSSRFRTALELQSLVETNLEPQVLSCLQYFNCVFMTFE